MKKKFIIGGVIVAFILCIMIAVPTLFNKRINNVTDKDINKNQSSEDNSSSGLTRYSNTDYFYLPDDNKFVKGTSKVKSFEGKVFSNNIIFANNGGCSRSYNSIDEFARLFKYNILQGNNKYNTLIFSSDTCGVEENPLWKVSQKVAFDSSACFINFNGHCESIDMDKYPYPMVVNAGLSFIFYKEAEIYYDTDDDGYGDTLTTGIYVSSIKHYNENVGQLLPDGTIILNDSKNNNTGNNNNTGSNNNTGNNNNTGSNNNTGNNNNTGSNSNTGSNNNTGNNNNTGSNNNTSDNNQVDKPLKKYTYNLVFNNFGKYYKENFGENGYTAKSIITFYIDGECVTDTKVDDISLRPAESYWIHSKKLAGIVNFELYIDNKKVETISVNVDEKSKDNWIYMD